MDLLSTYITILPSTVTFITIMSYQDTIFNLFQLIFLFLLFCPIHYVAESLINQIMSFPYLYLFSYFLSQSEIFTTVYKFLHDLVFACFSAQLLFFSLNYFLCFLCIFPFQDLGICVTLPRVLFTYLLSGICSSFHTCLCSNVSFAERSV